MESKEAKAQMVSKVTLSSGKVVLLRDIKIKHQELAAAAAAPKAGSSQVLLALHMQKELLKQLIVQINGKAIKAAHLEDLDELFTFTEFTQLNQVLNKLAGGDEDLGKYQHEIVAFGGN